MSDENRREATPRRSRWSTGLISAFGGPFAGFLWVGAGWPAVACLVFLNGIAAALVYIGFPVWPGVDLGGVVGFAGYGLMIVWAALVMPFTNRFTPNKWYSHGAWVLALALLTSFPAAFAIRTFAFQSFSIPSGSMEPTLQKGDYFFASKFAYGYGRYSAPYNLLPIEGRVFGAQPGRGDVVVFRSPDNPQIDRVARVVGLPGERVQMVNGVLHIDDIAVGLEDVGTWPSESFGRPVKLQRETLPGGVSHFVLDAADNSMGDNTSLFEVPQGHYFLMGDNRDNVNDSRFSVGYVPYENLVGKVVRLFWNSMGKDYSARQTPDVAAGK
jgi:signal peptidase I